MQISSHERLKEIRDLFGSHTDPAVSHNHTELRVGIEHFHRDDDRTSRGKFDRIAYDIGKDLP